MSKFKLLFNEYFDIEEKILSNYGALNICLSADLPLFIDPFLLFASKKGKYKELHKQLVSHLIFLKDISIENKGIDVNTNLFKFPEIKQNWLGLSKYGNGGKGLGLNFAKAAIKSFNGFYRNFGEEVISDETHIEKLTIINKGVGKDFISDFTVNLIYEFLLDYTQEFTLKYLKEGQYKEFNIRCIFDRETRTWQPKIFKLPFFYRESDGDFIILTPTDILTKDEAVINNGDFYSSFHKITNSLQNSTLRNSINDFFRAQLPKKPIKKDREVAFLKTVSKYPELIDYYIKLKEDSSTKESQLTQSKIQILIKEIIDRLTPLCDKLLDRSKFYELTGNSYDEALKRVKFMKEVIENNDGYRIFYLNGKPIAKEDVVQRIFRLTWYASPYDVNSEVNNGRGPSDYKVSFGSGDSTIVEFKLGKSSSLKSNLQNQTDIYKTSAKSANDISVVLCYSTIEISKVNRVLKQIGKEGHENIVVIDASPKVSASKVK